MNTAWCDAIRSEQLQKRILFMSLQLMNHTLRQVLNNFFLRLPLLRILKKISVTRSSSSYASVKFFHQFEFCPQPPRRRAYIYRKPRARDKLNP